MRALVFVALAALAIGCVPSALDLSNRHCPCTTGWTCDTASNLCVMGTVSDTGIDAARPDAAASDAGSDAAADDASMDAFASDTGQDAFVVPSDGGHDAGHDAFVVIGSDAGHDGGMPGASLCTSTLSSAVVCDGFESDPGPWTGRSEHLGSANTDSLQAQRGTRSLHAVTTAAGGQGAREFEGLGPYTSGDIWVRISVYVPSTADTRDFTWFSISEVAPPYAGISLGMGGDGSLGSYSSVSSTYVSDSTLTLPRNAWSCLELHVAVSDTAGAIEVYRNGVLGASASGLDTTPVAGFTRFAAGIDYTDSAQPPLEMWLDEVALSRSRLPCP